MDTGGLAQMTYNNNNFAAQGFTPSAGFASRGKASNLKRLSVALPPKVNSIHEDQIDNPLPRATSRSHLLAGLRTAPKSPASAPYSQSQHQFSNGAGYADYNQAMPQSAMGSNFGMNQYVMNAGQQTYALPDQVLAPPSLYDDDEMDPNVLEQLQLTGLYLAQRQQQLQQQLANITAAANQFQGMNPSMMLQQQQQQQLLQQMAMASQQQMQAPIEVPGQPGLYMVFNPSLGQYQYVQQAQQAPRRNQSPLARSGTMPNLSGNSSAFESPRPVFRAEVSPPPMDKPTPMSTRSITPPEKKSSPQPGLEHVEPLPPPSANAFRRGHHKKNSLSLSLGQGQAPSDGPKTSSAAIFGSARSAVPAGPMTGTFGPGNARAGEHPMRQPRGPPPLEELVALPTANHEGSKNFAARRRRAALNGLMRASSVRRSVGGASPTGSPVSDGDMSLNLSEEDEPGYYRKQSPIGSERSAKRGSQSSIDGSAPGSTVQTPATEDSNVFDMRSFYKQLPASMDQPPQERKRMMLGVLSATEKRRSIHF